MALGYYNKDKLEISGTFTGTEKLEYLVKITEEDGSKHMTSRKPWNSVSAIADINITTVLDTEENLFNDGLKIKFTASALTDYNDGDIWSFYAYPDFNLTESEADTYTDMGLIENGVHRDIVAVSKTSGKVALLKNYESDSPELVRDVYSLGTSISSVDFQNKNKEIYIATGKESSPKWAGYVSHDGLDGPLGQPKFVVEDSLDSIEIAGLESDTFDDFVVIQSEQSEDLSGSPTATSANANLIVGIKKDDLSLYVFNMEDSRLFRFDCATQPLRVRLDYSEQEEVINGGAFQVTGVAVLCMPQTNIDEDYKATVEFWDIPYSAKQGENSNRSKTIHVLQPTTSGNFDHFTDLLIVPTELSNSGGFGGDTHLVLSFGTSQVAESAYYLTKIVSPLFKYEDVDDLADGAVIAAADLHDISPKIIWEGEASAAGRFVKVQEATGSTTSTVNGAANYFIEIDDCNLAFGWHDASGPADSPTVMFTGKLDNLQYEEVAGAGNPDLIYPLFQDSNGDHWIVSWVTYNIPVDATGPNPQPMLMHLKDYGVDTEEAIDSAWETYPGGSPFVVQPSLADVANRDMPVSNMPLFGRDRKFIMTNLRIGSQNPRGNMHYYRPGNHKLYTFATGLIAGDEHTWWKSTTIPHVFPNNLASVYTKYNATTAVSAAYGVAPDYKTIKMEVTDGDWHDSRRWRLGDQYSVMASTGSASALYPSSTTKIFLQAPVAGDSPTQEKRLSIVEVHTTDASDATNELSGYTDWMTFSAITFDTGKNWVGESSNKCFYRFAIVYDGYQEGSLLAKTISKDNGGSGAGNAIVEPIVFDIKIDAEFRLPARVKSIVVYRADTLHKDDTEPDGLYRFVKEIDLLQFNFNAGASPETWSYTLKDDGRVEGSYGAINGVSETMHSLPINYTVMTEQNGYMFIGNCKHPQFDNAENYVFRSQPGKYSIYDWSKSFIQLPFVPKALSGFMGKVYVFGDTSMSVLNPESLFIEDTLQGVGCLGPKSVYSSSSGLFWVDNTNIYLASPQIKKVGTPILSADSYGWHSLSRSEKESSVVSYDSLRKAYLVFFTSSGVHRCWAYSSEDNRWDLWESPNQVMDTVFTSDGYTVLLLKNGEICKYLGGSNKRDWTFISKKMTLGGDTQDKKLRNIKLEASNKAGTTLFYKVDGSSDWTAGTDISSNFTGAQNWVKKIASGDNKNHWIQIKATGDNDSAASDYKGYSMGVVYKPKSIK